MLRNYVIEGVKVLNKARFRSSDEVISAVNKRYPEDQSKSSTSTDPVIDTKNEDVFNDIMWNTTSQGLFAISNCKHGYVEEIFRASIRQPVQPDPANFFGDRTD
ncbi:hypothetical protein C1645_814318 [Glomus cerebriforme]|uniref:Uncharacterized protein n=1 Tax=Glomus cerebriforme TaxID=658196 RepID=A0A397TH37_9GLOM|nr:hypothetical protein C1645_814318 [Glomus cerebriforme]